MSSPAASTNLFDPFESLQPTASAGTIDLLQPLNSSGPASKPLANDLDLFMMPTQSTQPSPMFFPQQTFMRPAMFPQTQTPMMFANPQQQQQQQQFNRPNNNSFNVSESEEEEEKTFDFEQQCTALTSGRHISDFIIGGFFQPIGSSCCG
jgi:hypothetical protein